MKKTVVYILIFTFLLNIAYAQGYAEDILDTVCENLLLDVPKPQVGSIGGEWAVIALKRSGHSVSEGYFEGYKEKAAEYIEKGAARRYTDYSRIAIALSSIGYNASAATEYLSDFDKTVSQGINGAIFALIALNNEQSELKEKYLDFIMARQHSDGGFGLSDKSETDITAMALQALSAYVKEDSVRYATQRAVEYIASQEITTSETASQIIIAMCGLGMDYSDYEAELMQYYKDGRFEHEKGSGVNAMATEQAACALTAIKRAQNGESSLYDITDVQYKNGGTGFLDISQYDAQKLEYLKNNGIMTGKSAGIFDPDGSITRAEFSAIVVRTLQHEKEIEQYAENYFSDVADNAWYRDYAALAAKYKLILGISDTEFAPEESLTHEMAMVILTRLCRECNMDISCDDSVLAEYSDGGNVSEWARKEVSFFIGNGFFNENPIEPQKAITRIETARMLAEILWKD